MNNPRIYLSLASASVIALSAAPAAAQTAPTDVPAATTADAAAAQPTVPVDPSDADEGSIVVTGSRIRRPNEESAVPITSVQGEEFFQTGRVSVGDVLNDLPSLRSTFSQANSTRFLGTAGLSLLDLRGLGTQRTLVLVNGRRHVAGDVLGNTSSVDVNTIPTDLIERVDVVTGGNSAIYGSDAIAGVVNFILRRDFEGIQVRGQSGISTYGDAGSYYGSILAGTNFADGRGNIAINLEYARQNDFYAAGRPNLRQNDAFIVVDSDPAGTPNGSDGVPDRRFFRDVRSASFSNGGTFLADEGGPFYASYLFAPNGNLIRQTGTRIGLGPVGAFQGGNGDNFRDGTQFGLSPRLDRYSANIVGRYEFSPAAELFLEATYSRTDTLGNASGPFFFNGGTTGSPREFFWTGNPFLNSQARQFLSDYYGVSTAQSVPFFFTRNVVELSNREEEATRETFRVVAGLRGTFNGDWNYEISANYGQLDEATQILGNVNLQRFLLAIDAVRDPTSGNIVCRASIDPAARIALETAGNAAYAQSRLAADVAACVPINLFGEGNITQAARNYLLQDSFTNARLTQFVVNGFVSGDTSGFLNLPGGPVGFAIGAEYRRETAAYQQDEATAAGITFYNSIPGFSPPAFEVKEAFAEIRFPLLRDVPFARELTFTAAGRAADYGGSTGTVFAYNFGGEWAPTRDLRFRANYSRAVRAPNLTDSGFPLSQNFATVTDPCSARNVGDGSSTRAANCAADGVPAGYDFVYLQTLGFLSGGNQNLGSETSDSYTIGGVYQPSFIPGLSLTVDYYDIQVNDVITTPTAQQIIDNCYDAATLNNQFCGLFSRAGAGGGPRGEIRGQILENSLQVVPLNYAALKVRGIDFELAYRRDLGFGNLNLRAIYTRVLQNDTFLDPSDPGRANQTLFELGDPRDAFNINADLRVGQVQLGYQLRYIGKMVPNQYEDYFSVQGRPPQNADYADITFYPATWYHDARITLNVTDRNFFYVGVDNIFNTDPPYGLTGIGGGSAIYNNRGRFFYAGTSFRF